VYVSGWVRSSYTDSNSQQMELNQAVVWKFSASSGSGDVNFGKNGVASVSLSADAWLHDLALDQNGNVLACGSDDSDLAVWRFTQAGILDAGFGVGGKGSAWTMELRDFSLQGIALDGQGRINAVGTVYAGDTSRYDALLVRLNP